ncbi:MAG: hypothetical protein Kow0073_10550 [Immundisolibacter sp.]
MARWQQVRVFGARVTAGYGRARVMAVEVSTLIGLRVDADAATTDTRRAAATCGRRGRPPAR